MFFLLCNSLVLAENSPSTSPFSKLENIGFVRNPEVLNRKFPMCDAFLKVEWIDTKKMIGYIQYEIIMEKTGERKKVWALVSLNDQGANYLDWNVFAFKQSGNLSDLFAFIRRARIVKQSLAVMILQDDKREEVFHRMNITNEASIAGYSLTVCLAYPGNKLAWIVEGKNVKHGQRTSSHVEEITKAKQAVGVTKEWENNPADIQPWLFDINYDGEMDVVYPSGGAVYSMHKNYYSNTRRFHPEGSLDRILKFPPINNECFIPSGLTSLTTDGKSYFFGIECNITKLTSLKQEE
jgi:hypothetical protein